jgi:predicted metal-dependent hydrolase
MEALAHILLGKLYRKPVARTHAHRYRLYLNRRDVRRQAELVRQIRGRKFISGPRGEHYDLEEVFEKLNRKYFNGLMGRPQLGWSRTASRGMLGHFDPSHNAIIISRIFDRPQVPELALEYVMFHEMLHLRYPVNHAGARRRVHTEEFRKAERAFAGIKEAKEMIKRL